jgi:hypothetical protein
MCFSDELHTSALEEHSGHEFATVKADFDLSIWVGGTGLGAGDHHQCVGSSLLSMCDFLAFSHQGQMDLISDIYKYLNNTLFHPAQVLSLGSHESSQIHKIKYSCTDNMYYYKPTTTRGHSARFI